MLILCDGRLAEKPYKMPVTRQNIYSLEELCYYIYHNIYTTGSGRRPGIRFWPRRFTICLALK